MKVENTAATQSWYFCSFLGKAYIGSLIYFCVLFFIKTEIGSQRYIHIYIAVKEERAKK